MPIEFDGPNSKVSANTIQAQSGSTITILSGHNLSGGGSGLTGLNATNLGSGTVPTARLGSGTANNGVFLRGDGSWAAAGSPSIDDNGNATAMTINSSEYVGIGTTNPQRILSVGTHGTGNSEISMGASTSGQSGILFGDATNAVAVESK